MFQVSTISPVRAFIRKLSEPRGSDKAFSLAVLFALSCCFLFEPTFAHANAFETGLQTLVDLLTGKAARSLAAVAVILMGIAAMFGRLEWSKAGLVIIGIAIVFGSATIVDMFAG